MEKIVESVERNLPLGKGVRRWLPGGGRLQLDRPQPFVAVHRRRTGSSDRATDKLVSYTFDSLIVCGQEDVAQLVETIIRLGVKAFGNILMLDIWAGPEPDPGQPPRFVVYGPKRSELIPLVESLQHALTRIQIAGRLAEASGRLYSSASGGNGSIRTREGEPHVKITFC